MTRTLLFLPHRGGGVECSEAERDGGGSRGAPLQFPLRLASLGTSPTMGEENIALMSRRAGNSHV